MRLLNTMKLLRKVYNLKNKTMLSYCLKCRKNTKIINPRVSKTNSGKAMILSKCAICSSKNSKCIKKPEASGILSNLVLKKHH